MFQAPCWRSGPLVHGAGVHPDERVAGMGAQAKKKGPVKGGKGGRKKQTGEAAPSWALEQLALEQSAAAAEADSLPKSASEALEAVASSSPEALAALLAQWGGSDIELATQANPNPNP